VSALGGGRPGWGTGRGGVQSAPWERIGGAPCALRLRGCVGCAPREGAAGGGGTPRVRARGGEAGRVRAKREGGAPRWGRRRPPAVWFDPILKCVAESTCPLKIVVMMQGRHGWGGFGVLCQGGRGWGRPPRGAGRGGVAPGPAKIGPPRAGAPGCRGANFSVRAAVAGARPAAGAQRRALGEGRAAPGAPTNGQHARRWDAGRRKAGRSRQLRRGARRGGVAAAAGAKTRQWAAWNGCRDEGGANTRRPGALAAGYCASPAAAGRRQQTTDRGRRGMGAAGERGVGQHTTAGFNGCGGVVFEPRRGRHKGQGHSKRARRYSRPAVGGQHTTESGKVRGACRAGEGGATRPRPAQRGRRQRPARGAARRQGSGRCVLIQDRGAAASRGRGGSGGVRCGQARGARGARATGGQPASIEARPASQAGSAGGVGWGGVGWGVGAPPRAEGCDVRAPAAIGAPAGAAAGVQRLPAVFRSQTDVAGWCPGAATQQVGQAGDEQTGRRARPWGPAPDRGGRRRPARARAAWAARERRGARARARRFCSRRDAQGSEPMRQGEGAPDAAGAGRRGCVR
jgi:hypothetical protein